MHTFAPKYAETVTIMTRYLTVLAVVLMTFIGGLSAQKAPATDVMQSAPADTIFVYLPNGRLDVYPPALVKSYVVDEMQVAVTTTDGRIRSYDPSKVDSVSHFAPKDKPYITSFKFNNKFNGQVFTDVTCEFGANGLITASVPGIGKWLAPSFQLSDKEAKVYVGRELQRSKVTRRSFAEPVDYVVTREGWQVLTLADEESVAASTVASAVREPAVSDPYPEDEGLDKNAVKLALTAEMLSTNAPTTIQNEDLPMILDGDENTFFHSTWSGSGYPTLPLDSCPWVEVKLPEAVHRLQFRYETRSANERWPSALRIDVSKDGEKWTQIKEFNAEDDGLPQTTLAWWTSPVVDLKDDYSYFRLVCTRAAYKNYLCLSELELFKVSGLFSNNKLYTLTCKRGGIVLNDSESGITAGQNRPEAKEEEKRFAILDINGAYYLYSPVNKQFLHSSNSFVSELGSPITFDDTHPDGEYLYMLQTKSDDSQTWWFNNNGTTIVINSWDKPDDGNRFIIEPVADFDPAEALKIAGVDDGGDPDPGVEPQPASSMAFQPYGTCYTVSVDWPTDRAVSVPTIYITTETGTPPGSKTTYINGTFEVDGAGVFPDMEETPMQIKGRGNSSWDGMWGKSPYRLKFESSVKPFGMTKGKSWILLANKIGGSMMTNAIGMKVAQLAGAAGANHIVPVNLYINGEYRGSYNFTEKIGFHNNSIDLDDETYASMLELDTYSDEVIYRAYYYDVPVKIHEPEFDDPGADTPLTPEDIMNDFNDMLDAAAWGEDISRWVEVDTFSAFYLTNEFIMNQELMHPKSTFLYKERIGDNKSLWKFGPVWDLDWSFGHEMNGGYFTTGATSDYISAKRMECNDLWTALRNAGETLDRAYYKAWTRFMRLKSVEELMDYCQEYFDYANSSFLENANYWGDGRNYSSQIAQQQSWLKKRAQYIYKRLTPYDLSVELPEDTLWTPYSIDGQPDPVDISPYINVRNAIQNLLADATSYTCNPLDLNSIKNTIQEQNGIVAQAKTVDVVTQATEDLRAAFVEFLATEELVILKALDLTNILLNNPTPVANADGWTFSDEPATFDAKNRVAEFIDQPEAQLSQKVTLPAGDYLFNATALTRSNYTSHIFAGEQTERLVRVTRSTASDLDQARAWFDQGNGQNSLAFSLTEAGDIELGIRADLTHGDHWTVWSDFHLVMVGKPVKPTVNDSQYKAALAAIHSGKKYRIFTTYDGKQFTDIRHYLTREGVLTVDKYDQDIFTFTLVEGNVGTGNNDLFVSPGWSTDAYFTNPTLSGESTGDIVPRGSISTNTQMARANWEGQVWYKEGDRYAVRATNAPAGSWGSNTYWFVENIANEGVPEASYSWDPYFLWELEEVREPSIFVLTYLVDGEVYKKQDIEVNTSITPEAAPQKEGYTFSGWSEIPATMPDHDVTVTGTFTVNTYSVRYYVARELFAEDKVDYGTQLVLRDYTPADPTRYTFLGWEGEKYETMPARDLEYYANIADGIRGLALEELPGVEAIYDAAGRKLARLQRGVNVLRMTDGTVRKLIVK